MLSFASTSGHALPSSSILGSISAPDPPCTWWANGFKLNVTGVHSCNIDRSGILLSSYSHLRYRGVLSRPRRSCFLCHQANLADFCVLSDNVLRLFTPQDGHCTVYGTTGRTAALFPHVYLYHALSVVRHSTQTINQIGSCVSPPASRQRKFPQRSWTVLVPKPNQQKILMRYHFTFSDVGDGDEPIRKPRVVTRTQTIGLEPIRRLKMTTGGLANLSLSS